MVVIKQTTPYEFLVRINKDGTISGSHVKFLETISDDGIIISQIEGPAQCLEQGGFPIELILNSIHISALATIEKLKEEVEQLKFK